MGREGGRLAGWQEQSVGHLLSGTPGAQGCGEGGGVAFRVGKLAYALGHFSKPLGVVEGGGDGFRDCSRRVFQIFTSLITFCLNLLPPS